MAWQKVKLGDIAIDLNSITDQICDDSGDIQIDMLPWSRVSATPTTIRGYGIQDAYTKSEVDQKVANITVNIDIDETELNAMLAEVLV